MDIKELSLHSERLEEAFSSCTIRNIRFYSRFGRLEMDIDTPSTLDYGDFCLFRDTLQEMTGARTVLHVHAGNSDVSQQTVQNYIEEICARDSSFLPYRDVIFTLDPQARCLGFLFEKEEDCIRARDMEEELSAALEDIGIHGYGVSCQYTVIQPTEVETVALDHIPQSSENTPKKKRRKNNYRIRMQDYTQIRLEDVQFPMTDVQFTGDVFKEETTETKAKRHIQSLSVFDGTDAITVKRFEGRSWNVDDLKEIGPGDRVRFFGSIENDQYSHELTFIASYAEKQDREKETDPAEEKRIEFHVHSGMSEMDGVCAAADIVQYCWDIGHEGLVLCDHGDVQAFVKAYNKVQALKSKDKSRNFKIALGCEMNMADDHLKIVRGTDSRDIDTAEYICFDLETTGLSCCFDHMIEFGAVRIKNQTVTDRLQMFIKPPVSIPPFIVSKTNITNDMVRHARTFAEACDEILEWIGDGILVAHNASFDFNFMNEELRRIGRPALTNTVIDTLDMSRAVLRDRKAYRLGNISRHYRIPYDEEVAHRADYDAEALAGVFLCLLADARKQFGCRTVDDLQKNLQSDRDFSKVRRSHVCVIIRDQQGVKDLYRLVTESNTKTLAIMGKSNTKEGSEGIVEPRVLRSRLAESRAHLLLGSACMNGEVFELAANGNDQDLEEAMRFYDYIELQPLANFSVSLAVGNIPGVARLKAIQKRIIAMAEKIGKPVIADSDAHYCRKDQKIFRDIFIASQGVGGVIHPLYIRDDVLRLRTKNPDQHIRMTEEMFREFAWLEDTDLIRKIVLDNPKKIFDSIEEVRPVPKGTFPPVIEGSDEKLRQICYDTAQRLYEYEGKVPDIVMDRLNTELDNIIRNGFGVHYYIAHLLVKKSNDDGYVVGSRGSVGSSFTATMTGITEVNPLPPHYLCPSCRYSEWQDPEKVLSGYDLPDKICPHCGAVMKGNGHNIPFQTFLGFNADKTPDIDLNFSGEYQASAHAFIKEVFGPQHAFRAGTISNVQEKTAFGYILGYCEKMHKPEMRQAMKEYLASGCQYTKRTTGQHPGGIIIIPEEYEASDFTPIQYPANDPDSEWMTTHYDFHDIHDNVLKFDILGHVDPTAMRLMTNISSMNPLNIPMNDPETMSVFWCDDALKADPRIYKRETGALGLPEFGTANTRKTLEQTRPRTFSDLVIISGLSHGTDVWAGNAQELIRQGMPLQEVIGCRDDIMTYLLNKKLEPLDAFKIMEDVRKGRGLREDQEKIMREHNVPDWYINSCKKIKYMFPKAHAVAYVMMAVRIAWYKVHEPATFYIQALSLRCTQYDLDVMMKGIEPIRARMEDISLRLRTKDKVNPVTPKEEDLLDTLEICEELYARGYSIGNIDLEKSLATVFRVDPDNPKRFIPPFVVLDGLGASAAESVERARNIQPFISKQDLLKRTQLTQTALKKLEKLGAVGDLQETNQMSLF